jgi:hypothetical protein
VFCHFDADPDTISALSATVGPNDFNHSKADPGELWIIYKKHLSGVDRIRNAPPSLYQMIYSNPCTER